MTPGEPIDQGGSSTEAIKAVLEQFELYRRTEWEEVFVAAFDRDPANLELLRQVRRLMREDEHLEADLQGIDVLSRQHREP